MPFVATCHPLSRPPPHRTFPHGTDRHSVSIALKHTSPCSSSHASRYESGVTNSFAGHKGSSGAGMCGGDWSAMVMAIFSHAASIETKPCCGPSPPRCRDVDRVTAGNTRGCCCCTGTYTEGGCAGEDSGGATVAGGAGGNDKCKESGGAKVADVGSCCCGKDDAAGRGVGYSGVTPGDGVDGWYHTSKPRSACDCWAEPLTAPPLAGDGDPAIAVPPPNGAHR